MLRRHEVDAAEHGGVGDERVPCDADADGDGAPQVVAVRCDRVEDGGGAKVDDDGGAAVEMQGGCGVYHSVSAHVVRALVHDADAGSGSCAHHERLAREERSGDVFEYAGERGYDAADGDVRDVGQGDALERQEPL